MAHGHLHVYASCFQKLPPGWGASMQAYAQKALEDFREVLESRAQTRPAATIDYPNHPSCGCSLQT